MKRQNYLLFLFSICLSALLGGWGYTQIGINQPVLPAPQLNLTPTPQPRPPAVTVVDSVALDHFVPHTSFTLQFNQPMDPTSAPAPLQTTPALNGIFTWNERLTRLTFTPAPGFAPGKAYVLALDEGLKTATGLSFGSRQRWQIRVLAEPRLVEQIVLDRTPGSDHSQPKRFRFDAVTVSSRRPTIKLTFDRPMDPDRVALALSVQPALPLKLRWQESILFIQPALPLTPNTTYEFSLDPAATDRHGIALAVKERWSIQTSPLLEKISYPSASNPQAPIRLQFNYPLARTSLDQALAITPTIAGQFTWNRLQTAAVLTPTEPLLPDTDYILTFAPSLLDANGDDLPPPDPVRFTTPSAILNAGPTGQSVYPDRPVTVTFSRPMDKAATAAAFQMTPPLSGTLSWQENRLIFQPEEGYLAETTAYTVTIQPSARDAAGRSVLSQPYAWSFRTGPFRDLASFGWGPKVQVVDADGQRAVQFQARAVEGTVPTFTFELYRLNEAQLVEQYTAALKDDWFNASYQASPETLSLAKRWTGAITDTTRAMQSLCQVAIPPDVLPGPYLLNINTGPHTHAQLLLLLTRHTLVLKAGDRQVVAWVTGLEGQPVPNLAVTLFDADGRPLEQGQTDANGVYRATLSAEAAPHLVVAGNGLDLTATGLSHQLRSLGHRRGWWWGPTQPQSGPHSAAHIYTDRPIYRPGQTVAYKAVLRRDEDARLDLLPAGSPVTVRIRDGRNNVVQTTVLSTSHFGTVHGDFHLAEGAMLGQYAVEVSLDNDIHRQLFKVEDYRKPDYQVNVTSNATKFVQGQTVEVTLEAGYFLGEPVAQAGVTVQLYQLGQPGYWNGAGSEEQVWYQGPHLTAGQTDAEGRLFFTFEAELGPYGQTDRRHGNLTRSLWAIEATVDDGSHQTVSSFQVIEVYNRLEQITLKTNTHFYRPGQTAPIRVEARTIFGQPLAGRALAYSVTRSGRPAVKSGSLTTDDTGQATLSLPLEKDGYYVVRVKAAGDTYQENGAATYLYAYDNSYAAWYGPPQAETVLSMHGDQDSYAPGDTARLLVTSTFSGPALLTVERSTTRREQMVDLTAPATLLELPIQAGDGPNIYVTLNAWQPLNPVEAAQEGTVNQPESQLHRAKLNLSVPVRKKALTVTITPDKAVYSPRQEATVTVRVTNNQGQPVSAELSLALVDEAIFALSEDLAGSIFDAFYYPRPHRVRTYDALAARRYWDNGLGGGGGGGGDLVGNPRRNFPDTAAWFPVLHTDANGEARVTLTLPDSLTGWRLTAKATTADTQVGEAFTTIRTHQEIVVRPILPGALTAGDQIELSALVHNYSDSRRKITVSVAERPEAGDCPASDAPTPAGDSQPSVSACRPGPKLALTGSVTQNVTLDPGALVVIGWPVSVLEAGQTQIFVRADSGGETRDAVQLPLSIRPLAIPEVTVEVGQMSGQWSTIIRQPDGTLPQSAVRLELSRSIAGTLLEGIEYLTGFPYGCVEQTMSRTLPTAVVGRAFHRLGVSPPTAEAGLPVKINAGLQRLYGFQHEDGGWGWWYDDRTHDYQTAWVVFGLAVIAEAGYEVDQEVTNRGVTWLNKNLEEMDPRTRAYALYSMAVAGQPNLTATLTLAEEPAGLDTFSRAGLALALAEAGQTKAAQKIVDQLAQTAVRKNGRVYWPEGEHDGHYHRKTMASTTRSTALALSALTRISPGHELEPGLVRWLMGQRRQQGWGTTNETAYAVLALTDHLLATSFSDDTPAGDYTVRLNGELFAAGRLHRAEPAVNLEIPADRLATGPNELEVSTTGNRPLYYVLNNRTYLAEEQIKAAGEVEVKRSYRHPDSKRPLAEVATGHLVEVVLSVNVPDSTTYVILEDLLPGGLEALNERLNTTSHAATAYEQPRLYWRDYGYNHKEVHPGRVSFFMTELEPGSQTFTYLARATHPGHFVALPAELYAMYDLSVWGRSGSSRFAVRP